MASNILSIGQSALAAAQVGISVTGNNIANASTPGYTRQVVVQSAAQAQNFGYGYLGQGTQISEVKRIYSDLLTSQLNSTQASSSATSTYSTQMQQIDNLLADSSAGLSPTIQSFFTSIQSLSSNPSDAATRQTMLSSAQTLVDRFQSLGSSINELRQGVNTQLSSNTTLATSYAAQIAKLNDVISKATSANNNTAPNDLLDQRDLLISDLSKVVKTTVSKQTDGSYNVFVGNGLPLVVGSKAYGLTTTPSSTDASRLEVAYVGDSSTSVLNDSSLPGGAIGGLIQFRSGSLDSIQNQLGQIATAIAQTFNTQNQQGLDATGKPGGNFFTMPTPAVYSDSGNKGTATVSASITDATVLTSSDYRVQYDGTNYNITRVSDGTVKSFTSLPQTLDGININITGTAATGDSFLIQPTRNGATSFSLAISNTSQIAAGAPALNSVATAANTGTATISAPSVSATYAASPLSSPFTLTYNSGANTLTGFPAGSAVSVSVGTTTTVYSSGTPVPYTSGATISLNGMSFSVSGTPNNGDTFAISANTSTGNSDNRNALLLAALQSKATLNNSTVSYESAFGQLVSMVGSKTNELKVTDTAETAMLAQATAAQQSESGVNLDEEATNLLRYQQAYQAAGKMMQIATTLFDTLLAIGH